MHARILFGILALAPLTVAHAADLAAYDRPVRSSRVGLGPAETVPPQDKEVRCTYFPTFMVKEIDEREVGAAQLSLLPVAPGQPAAPCQEANLPGEQVIDPESWSGYFAGAKGDYAVFSAGDGVHGGLGFAVVRPPSAKILYSAVAKGGLRFGVADGGRTMLTFQAIHAGTCSVATKGAACANQVGREAGIAPPDVAVCKRSYAEAKRIDAREWCKYNHPENPGCAKTRLGKMSEWDDSPTVVSYPVEVSLTGSLARERPAGAATGCWPAE